MLPGFAAILIEGATLALAVTANVLAILEPQALCAITEIFPLVELATAVIEVVVDDPVQPLGNVQM